MSDPWVLLVNMDEKLRQEVIELAEASGIDLIGLIVEQETEK